MSPVEHKEGCWYPRMEAEVERHREQWPNTCSRCDGYGGFPWYDSDTGYQGYDPCPECLEKAKCPRCGGGVISEAYWDAGHFANCDTCGFIESITRGCPYIEEPCSCLEPHIDAKTIFSSDQWEGEDQRWNESDYPYELSDHLYDAYRERGRF